MRRLAYVAGTILTAATPALAEEPGAFALADPFAVSDAETRYQAAPVQADDLFSRSDLSEGAALTTRRLETRRGAVSDQLSVTTRADYARSPAEAAYADPSYDVRFRRSWTGQLGRNTEGVSATLTPHLGVGYDRRGGSTEAGATLRIGRDLVPDGQDRFGDRSRWYVYAAGSGRAVGYNFARDRDGGYARSGMSHDAGAFLGDASLGVAMRKGPIQGSVGVVYREIENKDFNAGGGVDNDVSEGLIAFQLSIRPD